MPEQELINILKKFGGFTPDMLYNDLIIIDKENSEFNNAEYNKLVVFFSLLANGSLSYQEYSNIGQQLHKVRPEVLEKLKTTINKHYRHWVGISSPKTNTAENIIKIYLSIDNGSLHFFANQLFLSCLEREYLDFDFKINNTEGINRRDNVVIYCNENNFGMYVSLIQELIAKYPNIKFNSPHLLGVPYDEQIYCGMDYDEGKTSYTDKLCQAIFNGIKNGKPIEDIVSKISSAKLKQSLSFKALAEKSKKKI